MESIDKLREWVNGLRGAWIDTKDNSLIFTTGDDMPPSIASVNLREHLNGILDGIEREVEQYVGAEIDALPMTDENMAESGWVRLPVDADGEPIHIGDVMENIVCPSVHREVTGVGVECFYGWDEGNGRYSQFDVNCYRHHHAPTVEDVLREFAEGLGVPVANSYIAVTAAKLRLAGEGE